MFLFWFIHQIFLSANFNGNVRKSIEVIMFQTIRSYSSLTKLYGIYSLKFSSDVLILSLCCSSSDSSLGVKVIVFL